MLGVKPELILLMLLTTAFAFWSANWETRNLNKRILPQIGGLESITIGCVLMVVTAFQGTGIWDVRIFDIRLLTVIYWLCLPWLLVVVFGSLRSGRSRLSDLFGFAWTLTPLSIWLLLSPSGVTQVDFFTSLGYISLGLVATIMTGDLMRQHKMGIPYHQVQWVFFAIGLLLLSASVLREMDKFTLIEKIILSGQAMLAAAWLVWQGVDTYKNLQPAKP